MADIVVENARRTRASTGKEADTMTDNPTRWIPMAEAAAAMGTSIRTLQRKAKAGEVRTMTAGRKVLVAVDDTATDGRQAGEVVRLEKRLEATERFALTAVSVIERERDDLVRQLADTRRKGRTAVAVGFACALASAVAVGFALSTADHRDDLAGRLAAAEQAAVEARADALAEAECRRQAEADRDRMAGQMLDDIVAAIGQ
jgi:hypothetical protein